MDYVRRNRFVSPRRTAGKSFERVPNVLRFLLCIVERQLHSVTILSFFVEFVKASPEAGKANRQKTDRPGQPPPQTSPIRRETRSSTSNRARKYRLSSMIR